ncbi:MAG: DUF5668 domain-containing protein [Candidatus Izemoplasmatales bacterium]
MNSNNRKVLGYVLLFFGVIFLLSRLNLFSLHLFFNGWWTLLIIIPAIVSMSKQGVTFGNIAFLILGVYLFLNENGINFEGYLLPALLVLLGGYLLIKK